MAADTPSGSYWFVVKMFASRGEGEDETILYEDEIELIVTATAVVEADILDTILTTLFEDPYLEPSPEASYVFENAAKVSVTLGNPVDP